MKDALKRWLGLANTPVEVPVSSASTRPSPADATVPRGCYVYAHESLDGDVFYIGKGTGRRAWVRGRDMLWELYVTERLGGEYRVRVLEDGLSEDEALEQEEAWMAHYGDALVNRQNMSRGLDMEAFEREHALRDEVESVHAQAIVEQDAGQRVILARRALDLHYQSTQACSEKGVVGELLRANPMGHMRLLDVLVSAHLELGGSRSWKNSWSGASPGARSRKSTSRRHKCCRQTGNGGTATPCCVPTCRPMASAVSADVSIGCGSF